MNAGMAALGVAALVLAGIVAAELQADLARPDPAALPAPAETTAQAGAASAPDRAAEIRTLLARPLFSATRRPPYVAAAPPPAPVSNAPLPRMTAIVIDGSRRSAIFAGAGGGKPVAVAEGGRLGAYTVQSIKPREVVVVGPDGSRVLRTTFDSNRVAPASAFVSPGSMPGFPQSTQPANPPIVTPGGHGPGANTPFFLPPIPSDAGNGAAR